MGAAVDVRLVAIEVTDLGAAGDGFEPRLQPTTDNPASVAAIATAETSVGGILKAPLLLSGKSIGTGNVTQVGLLAITIARSIHMDPRAAKVSVPQASRPGRTEVPGPILFTTQAMGVRG